MFIPVRLLLLVLATAALAVVWTGVTSASWPPLLAFSMTGVVLAVILAWAGLRWVRSRRMAREIRMALRAPHEQAPAGMDPIALEFALLRHALLGSRLGGQAPSIMPLYLVCGVRGSGKSSLLDHCGVSYWYESAKQDGCLTARACNEAAFIEYDVNTDVKAAELERRVLVRQLERATRARPLAGILVCIPVDEALTDRCYETIRPLLDAVSTNCGAHSPIHLVVTAVDGLPGYGEFLAGVGANAAALGTRTPVGTAKDPERWDRAIANALDGVFETSVGLMNGSSERSPVRFGLELSDLARPLQEFVRKLETPSLAAEPLLLRSLFFTSTRGRTGPLAPVSFDWLGALRLSPNAFAPAPSERDLATPFSSLAMKAILEDGRIARDDARRQTRRVLTWTLPIGVPITAAALTFCIAMRPGTTEGGDGVSGTSPPKQGSPPDNGGDPPDSTPPKSECPGASGFEGQWLFQTRVEGGATPGGVGTIGHYEMTISIDNNCKLTASMKKLGWTDPNGGRYHAHKPIQESVAFLHPAGERHPGDVEYWALAPKAVFSRAYDDKRFEIYFAFGLGKDGSLLGAFKYLADPNPQPKLYWGYVAGNKEHREVEFPRLMPCAAWSFVTKSSVESDPTTLFRRGLNDCDAGASR